MMKVRIEFDADYEYHPESGGYLYLTPAEPGHQELLEEDLKRATAPYGVTFKVFTAPGYHSEKMFVADFEGQLSSLEEYIEDEIGDAGDAIMNGAVCPACGNVGLHRKEEV